MDNYNTELAEFINTVLSILYKISLIKRKFIRANNSAHMTKDLRAAIMQRSKLRQKILKMKRDYFKQLNNQAVSDNRKFWQTVIPLFSESVS